MNVTAAIRATAERVPGATAVILADGQHVDYRTLDGLIDAAGQRLTEAGLRPGAVVGLGVLGPDEFPGLLSVLALARLGIASADLSVPAARLDLVLTEGGRAPPPGCRALPLERLWSNIRPATRPGTVNENPTAPLRLMASSGTTGRPKYAAVSHALSAARLVAAAADSDRHGPVRVVGRGLGAEGGLRSVLRAFATGAAIVLTNPHELLAAMLRHRVTGLITSPVSLGRFLSAMGDAPPPPDLAVLEVTGAPCPTKLRALARARLRAELFAGAGCMECGRLASAPLDDEPITPMRLSPGIEAETFAPDDGAALPSGTPGRLRYRGPGTVPGYEDDPALTAAHFAGGWFQSGDFGTVSADGFLRITGREAELINSGGVKVAPVVIEEVLLTLRGVTEAVAFGAPDALGVEQIWAAFTATRLIGQQELTNHCGPALGAQAPRHVLQVPQLPRTESGKVLRAMLSRYATERIASMGVEPT